MNYVSLVGRVRKSNQTGMILIEINRPSIDEDSDNLFIPCRYWARGEHNLLTSLKEGTMIALRGRIDMDKKGNLFVTVENLEIIK